MTIKELIEYLQTQPQDLQVVYNLYSGYYLLETRDISIRALQHPRNDGWVDNERPDKPTIPYLIFPGN